MEVKISVEVCGVLENNLVPNNNNSCEINNYLSCT